MKGGLHEKTVCSVFVSDPCPSSPQFLCLARREHLQQHAREGFLQSRWAMHGCYHQGAATESGPFEVGHVSRNLDAQEPFENAHITNATNSTLAIATPS